MELSKIYIAIVYSCNSNNLSFWVRLSAVPESIMHPAALRLTKCPSKHHQMILALHLAGHGRGFHVGHGAHPPDWSRESSLDLLQRPSAGLGHERHHEDETADADEAEAAEGTVLTYGSHHVGEEFGHHEGARPVEASGHAGGAASDLRGQDLAHHEPRNGPKTEREAYDVDHEAHQRDVAYVRHVHAVVLHVEEAAQHEQRHYHAHARHVQQYLASQTVDQGCCHEGRREVHYTHYYRAYVGVYLAAGVLE